MGSRLGGRAAIVVTLERKLEQVSRLLNKGSLKAAREALNLMEKQITR
jgi:hypothetical protein